MLNKLRELFFKKEFLLFLIIGIINTLSAQVIYLIFIYLELSAGLSSLIGDILSVIVSYILNLKFTYGKKHNWRLFFMFPMSYIPGWVINAMIVVLCVYFGIPKIYAKLVSLPITIPINFLCMSMIFKIKGEKND